MISCFRAFVRSAVLLRQNPLFLFHFLHQLHHLNATLECGTRVVQPIPHGKCNEDMATFLKMAVIE